MIVHWWKIECGDEKMKLNTFVLGLVSSYISLSASCDKPVERYCLERHGAEYCLSEKEGIEYFEIRNENNWKRYSFNGLTLTHFVELDSEGFRWNFPGDPQFPNDEEVSKIRNSKAFVLLNWPR